MSQELGEFIKNNSKFLKIQDGEDVTLIYKGYSIIPDRFNPGKETVQYLFLDPMANKTLPWAKSSTKVAAQMAKIEVDTLINITRMGEGTETTYRIKPVKESKVLGTIPDEEIPF